MSNLSTVFSVKITKENENRFKEESVDLFGVKKAAKRSFLCKDRREFDLLQSTLGKLQKTSEIRIKEYDNNKRDLQWILYNLRQEKTGKLGKVVNIESTLLKLSHNLKFSIFFVAHWGFNRVDHILVFRLIFKYSEGKRKICSEMKA